ncbi:hypothetical protein ABMA28_012937 [Loxostege sticticalis]|uniref:PPIase cyclophilin-type domain-containing protein n=1 Tax=Loxostege sticticalis TaxID=481309 RepID=A0ABD0S496_LOXSC
MTLIGAILNKVNSKTSLNSGRYISPPPEPEERLKRRKKRPVYKYDHVRAAVDTSAPRYDAARLYRNLPEWKRRAFTTYKENMTLLTNIKKTHFNRGLVDSRWKVYPERLVQYYKKRVDFYKRVETDNRALYKRIVNTSARLPTAAELARDWAHNRQQIIHRAQAKFVLFPPVPQETIEDAVFIAAPGVKRPRVYLSLRMRDCAVIGDLCVELFTDRCPVTCQLFLELLGGDGLGHGYVGTCFFRQVPGLYWSGGDVICDNGYGCYAQRGRRVPIGAENYHYSHCMPGLLSMRVTRDDEVCGIFNITFKPLPQFDLQNVVFGRIIRPCATYEAITQLGSALSSRPQVLLCASRRREGGRWVCGQPNTKIAGRTKFMRD